MFSVDFFWKKDHFWWAEIKTLQFFKEKDVLEIILQLSSFPKSIHLICCKFFTKRYRQNCWPLYMLIFSCKKQQKMRRQNGGFVYIGNFCRGNYILAWLWITKLFNFFSQSSFCKRWTFYIIYFTQGAPFIQ